MARKIQARHWEYRSRSYRQKACTGIGCQWLRQHSRSGSAIRIIMLRQSLQANDREWADVIYAIGLR